MESGRSEQINSLLDKGWYFDEECDAMSRSRRSAGGPNYMKSPEGIMHAVGYGQEIKVSE